MPPIKWIVVDLPRNPVAMLPPPPSRNAPDLDESDSFGTDESAEAESFEANLFIFIPIERAGRATDDPVIRTFNPLLPPRGVDPRWN